MIEIKNLHYKTGSFFLKNINLTIRKNEYFVLLGPTGSGKTTLLKNIAGLTHPEKGDIFLNGNNISRKDPAERSIGYLPQDYSLFPHLDVNENISFGLKMKRIEQNEREERISGVKKMLNIDHLMKRKTESLSGGEKQRVALARALVVQPEAILLDEPFSAIDQGLKVRLWIEIKDLLLSQNIAVLHVTHSIAEASALGDRMGVLINGSFEQIGSGEEVFVRPSTKKVAQYLGINNIFSGKVTDCTGEKLMVKCQELVFAVKHTGNYSIGDSVELCIRPQDIKIIREGYPIRDELKENLIKGRIISSYFIEDTCSMLINAFINLELRFPAYVYKRYELHNGKLINLGIKSNSIILYGEEKN